jgi:biopolymer transport protein ExbD
MADIQTNDQGNGGAKNKQKKQIVRVDFTPMVDMNMLLITFFMLCTSLLKSQTMNINMPTKEEEVTDEEKNKVRESTAITILLGANDEIFFYEGMPATDGSSYEDPDFLRVTLYGAEGIRDYLIARNRGPYEQIQALKLQLQNLEITDEQFRERVKEIQDKAIKEDRTAPTVMIKPTDLATYANMVAILDEMLIANIGAYAILDVADGDRHLLYKKTGNPEYLTEEQRKELEAGK